MRIAQLAPLFLEVPPREYGGTERIVHTLTEQLVKRGHDVTLFAAQGSTTAANLYPTGTLPLWETGGNALAWHAIEIEEMVRHSAEFDVIHSHLEVLPWLGGERYRSPLVTTMHGRLDLDEQRQVLKTFRHWPLVSISDAQRRPVDDLGLCWLATVYHGLDLEGVYSQGAGAGGYLAFISRFSPEKGPAVAIRAARKAGMKLVMAGPIPDENSEFFEAEVEPLLKDSDVELVGELDDAGKNKLLGNAAGLLLPIQWDEPFGLVFIESLACGTPIVSFPRGSVPELMENGRHGFLVNDEDELADACRRVTGLDRTECRRHALERFSPERMAADYERVYSGLVRRD